MNNIDDKYIIIFDNKYNENNFNIKKTLFFFLGKPHKKINIKYASAFSSLKMDNNGIKIKDFKIINNSQGKKLNKLLNKDSKSILLYRNITKKSDIYQITICFIDIKLYSDDEYKIISKKNKMDELFII